MQEHQSLIDMYVHSYICALVIEQFTRIVCSLNINSSVLSTTYRLDCGLCTWLAIKGALIHHSAYQILVYQLVSCSIGIGKFLIDIKGNS